MLQSFFNDILVLLTLPCIFLILSSVCWLANLLTWYTYTDSQSSCSANSPSLTSLHHLSVSQRSAAPSPSLSASVAHSSFTSSGNHHQTHHQDVNLPADMLEPIRPDICLHHLWSDQSSWLVLVDMPLCRWLSECYYQRVVYIFNNIYNTKLL